MHGTAEEKSRILQKDLEERSGKHSKEEEGDLIVFQKWMELVRKWIMCVVAYSFSRHYYQNMEGPIQKICFLTLTIREL